MADVEKRIYPAQEEPVDVMDDSTTIELEDPRLAEFNGEDVPITPLEDGSILVGEGEMLPQQVEFGANLADELDGHLTNPENLSQSQALRLSSALQAGFGEVIRTALEESSLDSPQAQWQILLPILTEAENPQPEYPKPRPGCPRRTYRPRPGLTIRREQTRDGWCLHFTGREATSWMLDNVFADIERKFEPG